MIFHRFKCGGAWLFFVDLNSVKYASSLISFSASWEVNIFIFNSKIIRILSMQFQFSNLLELFTYAVTVSKFFTIYLVLKLQFFSEINSALFVPGHPHCHGAALISVCTLDVTSTVMTRMHVRSSVRADSPLSGSSVNESCAQDTEQKHGKHGSGAPLSSFPLILVVVLAEHGGRLSSVDRDRGW